MAVSSPFYKISIFLMMPQVYFAVINKQAIEQELGHD